MTDIQTAFAVNVRKYRKAAHLSQEKLAELAGLHRTYIGGIEQRRVNVSLKNIGKIAAALGVEPAILLSSSNETSMSDTTAAPFIALTQATCSGPRTSYALVSWHDDTMTIQMIGGEPEAEAAPSREPAGV